MVKGQTPGSSFLGFKFRSLSGFVILAKLLKYCVSFFICEKGITHSTNKIIDD